MNDIYKMGKKQLIDKVHALQADSEFLEKRAQQLLGLIERLKMDHALMIRVAEARNRQLQQIRSIVALTLIPANELIELERTRDEHSTMRQLDQTYAIRSHFKNAESN